MQDYSAMNISASLGVAIREFPLATGFADYLLYADGKAIGVVEAKPVGHTLSGVETQSGKYLDGLPGPLRWRSYHYEQLLTRDKVNLDIFLVRDQTLKDTDDVPDILAQEIADDLQAALEQFTATAEKFKR